jgi:hypothetical protein
MVSLSHLVSLSCQYQDTASGGAAVIKYSEAVTWAPVVVQIVKMFLKRPSVYAMPSVLGMNSMGYPSIWKCHWQRVWGSGIVITSGGSTFQSLLLQL